MYPTDSPAHNLQAASHFASQSYHTFFFLLSISLPYTHTPTHSHTHTQSRTLMPFRLVSHVTNADMNLPGDKGPNYSRGLIVHGPTVSNCLPSVKQGAGKCVIVNERAHVLVSAGVCVYAAVTESLSVHVCRGEAGINTGVKYITVTVNVMQSDCCQSRDA